MPISTIPGAALDSTSNDGTGGLQIPTGTTAQRPVSPSVGTTRWNTTLGLMEVHVGSNIWQAIASTALTVQYLIVAGGGGGGGAGGGGAGGVIYNAGTLINGGTTYTVTVGAGGTGAQSSVRGAMVETRHSTVKLLSVVEVVETTVPRTLTEQMVALEVAQDTILAQVPVAVRPLVDKELGVETSPHSTEIVHTVERVVEVQEPRALTYLLIMWVPLAALETHIQLRARDYILPEVVEVVNRAQVLRATEA